MQQSFQPLYLALFQSGQLAQKARIAHERLTACDMCPRRCKANRLQASPKATCRLGEYAVVASFGPHFGEEAPLRGRTGSGTIFFSSCNLRCVFCQNFDISQQNYGHVTPPEELASMMLQLQAQNCHNINLVSPSHIVPQILAALVIAVKEGLRIPLVYNSGGYDALDTLMLLDGIIDIYMPDIKYADPAIAKRLSGVADYPAINQQAVREMHRQVGDLVMDDQGIARRGLLVRHLVLPNGMAGTEKVVDFLANHISTRTYLNLMDQYRPCYRAAEYPEINRRITSQEYQQAIQLAQAAGLERFAR